MHIQAFLPTVHLRRFPELPRLCSRKTDHVERQLLASARRPVITRGTFDPSPLTFLLSAVSERERRLRATEVNSRRPGRAPRKQTSVSGTIPLHRWGSVQSRFITRIWSGCSDIQIQGVSP